MGNRECMSNQVKESIEFSSDRPEPPKYLRVRSHLAAEIVAGRLAPGEALPKELDLAKDFSVGRNTIRQALTELEEDGLIRRIRGKGTFVQDRKEPELPRSMDNLTLVVDNAKITGNTKTHMHISVTKKFLVGSFLSLCLTATLIILGWTNYKSMETGQAQTNNVSGQALLQESTMLPGAHADIAASGLIAQVDYSDTFSVNNAYRPFVWYFAHGADLTDGCYDIEQAYYGLPKVQWRRTTDFSFQSGASADHNPDYPGDTGNSGASSGMARSGSGEWSIPYSSFRDDYVVQIDAIIPRNASLEICSFAATPAFWWTKGGLVVNFRRDGISLLKGRKQDFGIENETSFKTGIAADDNSWHNFAVRFNKRSNTVSVFVDRSFKGTVDLNTFAGGIYRDYSSEAVAIGTRGLGWIDNFRVGSPSQSNNPKSPVSNGVEDGATNAVK